jgi:hypothetical protein
MMKCPSSGSIRHRFLCRYRTSGNCPQPPEPAEVARFHLNPALYASLVSGKSHPRTQPSRTRSLPFIVVASDVGALSP